MIFDNVQSTNQDHGSVLGHQLKRMHHHHAALFDNGRLRPAVGKNF